MTPMSPPVQTALVLAAGQSTRIRSVAGNVPKPLLQVAGQAVLERNLRQLAAAGVADVWINLHYLGEQIEAYIGTGEQFGLRVRYSWEPTLLGTAGAAKKLEAELSGASFFVVYGDNLTALDVQALTAQHVETSALATVAVFDRDHVPNTGLAGGRLVLAPDRRVVTFEEGGTGASPYVNAGIYLLEPTVLGMVPLATFSDFGRDVFPDLIARGSAVYAYPIDGYCLGVDTPESLARAEALLTTLDSPGQS